MKPLLLSICLILSAICCVPASGQCEGGSCSLPETRRAVVVRTQSTLRAVATARPFRVRWFGRR